MSKGKHKLYIFLFFILLLPTTIKGLPKSYIEHYGAEDGLPQNTVMSILQDHKGFIWLSTWDGLCRFDGYEFTSYRNEQVNSYPMGSNRIDYIIEDQIGNIWTLSYDNEAQRFNPRTESFMGIRSLPKYENTTFRSKKIQVAPSGKVWLLSENDGCISIVGEQFDATLYNKEAKGICNRVNSIYEDKEKNSWILTDEGVFTFNEIGIKIDDFGVNKKDTNDQSTQFFTANEINNEVWLGSNNGKIWIYNKKSQQFRPFNIPAKIPINEIKQLSSDKVLITTTDKLFFIYHIRKDLLNSYDITENISNKTHRINKTYIDQKKRIWFDLDRTGISLFLPDKEKTYHFSRKVESPIAKEIAPAFFVLEDKKGNVWVHPRGGGFSLYDDKNNKLIPFHNDIESSDWLFSSMLHTAFFDKQNNLWMGTYSNGLEKVVFSDEIFQPMIVNPSPKTKTLNQTRSIFEDENNNLWIASKDGKIHIYDKQKNYLGYLGENGLIGKENHHKPLLGLTYCIMQDTNQNIWIGTRGYGIYKLQRTKDKSQTTYKITHYKNNKSDLYSLSDNNIYSIYEDKRGQIWIGTYGGGLNLISKDERFINFNNDLSQYPIAIGSQVRTISEDQYGNIFVGTTLGLLVFDNKPKSPNEVFFKYYNKHTGNKSNLTANDIFDIITTKGGETYLATFGGGINKVISNIDSGFPTSFKAYTTEDGLSSNITLQIAEDNEGNLWISSEGNISILNPKTNEIKTHREIYKIIKGFSFTEGSKLVSKTGMIHFGYSNGILTINPYIIRDTSYKPYVALTNFQINNKDIKHSSDSPLKESIDDTKSLHLNHKQNYFNIEFASIDYTEKNQIQYAYILEGLDKEWVVSRNQRLATYNNLAPGNYTFKVKSTNSDGIWMDNAHTLPIKISPSIWKTSYAKIIYIVLIIIIMIIIFRSLMIYYRLKDRVVMEQEKAEMRTRFFIDISHEIRTPLTMIVSPIEDILENNYDNTTIQSHLRLVQKNALRMLRMVNQILDFRKIQKSKLKIEKTRIAPFIENICKDFEQTAELQNIKLTVKSNIGNAVLWIDRDSVEKLIYNLLSNAFKYSQSGKRIDISIYSKNYTVAIEIKDQGKGMTKDIMSKLFTRFASFSNDRSKPSTGIGLSTVKEIADKHKAKIEVSSKESEGTTFTVYFITGNTHFNDDNATIHFESDTPNDTLIDSTPETANIREHEPSESKQEYKLLIVEDDEDLRNYIVNILSKYYDVLEAADGVIGYEIATTNQPDFILSDIMMPRMDGIELLQKIRQNKDISHIPFILLTSKTNTDSKLEGIQYGADDYITKPFNIKILRARIDNIIKQRQLLYQSFFENNKTETEKKLVEVNSSSTEKEDQTVITPQDEQFIKDVKRIIEDNIDRSDFVVEDLASEMLMSRTVFFKKLKSLTGLAPVQFIREVKIRYAAQLIISHDYTIKEISYIVGIADPKYFTRWFKSIIGVTPSQYREQNRVS